MSNKSKITLPAFAAAVEKARGHQGPPEKPVSFDDRKPFSPDRPGRYLLRDGKMSVTILVVFGKFAADTIPTGNLWINGAVPNNRWWDIIARAPDDAAWCLAQARLLCPDGYAVAPEDLLTHMNDWKVACTRSLQVSVADEDKSYWQHQLDVLSKIEGVIASASEGK